MNLDEIRLQEQFPVTIRFGLEICYFKEYEGLIAELTKDKGFGFSCRKRTFRRNRATRPAEALRT